MLPRKAIQQTSMTLAAVAMAVARLLIQDFPDARSQGISILHNHIAEHFRT
jgi:hypothetical protein